MHFSILNRRRRQYSRLALLDADLSYSLKMTSVYLTVMLSAHVLAMMVFEKLSFWDSVWLTLTTVTTVGYGDISAATFWGRLSTILILFVGSIFIVAKAAGDYFDYRARKREKMLKGDWSWNMNDYIAILNTPASNGEEYLNRLIEQFRSSRDFSDMPIQILTRSFPDGLPKSLRSHNDVTHYTGRADLVENLQAINILDAKIAIILSKREGDKACDGRTFDMIHRLRDLGFKGSILAECVDDANRQRLISSGADIVIRPIRAYPEMIVRAFVAPGSEQIIENMFSSSGDEYLRFDTEVSNKSWSEVVCSVSQNDLGTAIGYIDKESCELHCNPPSSQLVNASSIFIIAREESIPSISSLNRVLQPV